MITGFSVNRGMPQVDGKTFLDFDSEIIDIGLELALEDYFRFAPAPGAGRVTVTRQTLTPHELVQLCALSLLDDPLGYTPMIVMAGEDQGRMLLEGSWDVEPSEDVLEGSWDVEPSEDVLEGRPDMGSIEDHYRDNGTR
jgi:hypothetical protein